MKHAFAVALALALATGSAAAHDYKLGDVTIDHPWSRATPKGAKVAGGYVKLTNGGAAADRLVGGTFAAARGGEIHEMSSDGGVMKMRQLKSGLEVKPGATVELKPGSYHLMFTDLTRPLTMGEKVKGTLVFEKAGTVEVEYTVESIGGGAPAKSGMHH
jgi:copper(I)-binding protein